MFYFNLAYQADGVAVPMTNTGKKVMQQATAVALEINKSKVKFMSAAIAAEKAHSMPAMRLRGSSNTEVTVRMAVTLTLDDLLNPYFTDKVDEVLAMIDRLKDNVSSNQFVPLVRETANGFGVSAMFANLTISTVESSNVATSPPTEDKKNPTQAILSIVMWIAIPVSIVIGACCIVGCTIKCVSSCSKATTGTTEPRLEPSAPPAGRAAKYVVVDDKNECNLGTNDCHRAGVVQCLICQEPLASVDQGATCVNGHAICWHECFGPFLRARRVVPMSTKMEIFCAQCQIAKCNTTAVELHSLPLIASAMK